jgi:hypothetical protein
MTRFKMIVALGALMAAGPQSALADLRSACSPDYVRFCSSVTPGEGRVARCLQDNRDSLTNACRTAFSAAASCRPEIERHCRGVAEPSQIKTCLQGNAGALSESCAGNLSRF